MGKTKAEQTPAQKEKIAFVMGEFTDGELKTSHGKTVTERDQAIAIALSEAGVEKKSDGGEVKKRGVKGDLSKLYYFQDAHRGAEFYSLQDETDDFYKEEIVKSDRWYVLMLKNQKGNGLTANEYKEFKSLSLSLLRSDEYTKGGSMSDGGEIKDFVNEIVENQIERTTIRIKDESKFQIFLADIQPYIDKKIVRVKRNPIDKNEVWISLSKNGRKGSSLSDGGRTFDEAWGNFKRDTGEAFSGKVYIDYRNKDKNYINDRKYFKTYEEAEKWAKKEFEKFHPDMINYTYAEGGEIEDLELKRLKLLNKAFKMMPNSPKQLKVREEIADLDKKISQLKEGKTYAKGGEIEKLIKDGNVIFSKTKKEHSDIYGIDSDNPLFIQHLCIDTNKREKGLGKKVIDHIEDYAIRNNHDLIFGHITPKSKYGKKDICDAEKVKSWMVDKGYNIAPDTNDFYKKLSYADGGLLNKSEESDFNEWIEDGNAFEQSDNVWVEQTTQYGKKFTLNELKKFFKKEFRSDAYAEGGDIIVYGTKEKVKEMYRDYKNNFLSVEKFAEHYGMSNEKAKRLIEIGRSHAEKDGYYVDGGDIDYTEAYKGIKIEKTPQKHIGKKWSDVFPDLRNSPPSSYRRKVTTYYGAKKRLKQNNYGRIHEKTKDQTKVTHLGKLLPKYEYLASFWLDAGKNILKIEKAERYDKGGDVSQPQNLADEVRAQKAALNDMMSEAKRDGNRLRVYEIGEEMECLQDIETDYYEQGGATCKANDLKVVFDTKRDFPTITFFEKNGKSDILVGSAQSDVYFDDRNVLNLHRFEIVPQFNNAETCSRVISLIKEQLKEKTGKTKVLINKSIH